MTQRKTSGAEEKLDDISGVRSVEATKIVEISLITIPYKNPVSGSDEIRVDAVVQAEILRRPAHV